MGGFKRAGRGPALRYGTPIASVNVSMKYLLVLASLTALNAGSSKLRQSQNSKYLRVQSLLDRAHFSPGEIDGAPGGNTRKALQEFQLAHGLRADGNLGPKTLSPLDPGIESVPTLVSYTLTEQDVRGPFVKIPNDLM